MCDFFIKNYDNMGEIKSFKKNLSFLCTENLNVIFVDLNE